MANAALIEFRPSSTVVDDGTSFNVDVWAAELTDDYVGAFDIFVDYDPLKLALSSVTFDTFLDGPLDSIKNQILSSGSVNAFEVSLGTLTIQTGNDPFRLFGLTFDALMPGTANFSFGASTLLSDELGDRLALTSQEGAAVTIREGTTAVPEPGSLFLMMLGLVVLALKKMGVPTSSRLQRTGAFDAIRNEAANPVPTRSGSHWIGIAAGQPYGQSPSSSKERPMTSLPVSLRRTWLSQVRSVGMLFALVLGILCPVISQAGPSIPVSASLVVDNRGKSCGDQQIYYSVFKDTIGPLRYLSAAGRDYEWLDRYTLLRKCCDDYYGTCFEPVVYRQSTHFLETLKFLKEDFEKEIRELKLGACLVGGSVGCATSIGTSILPVGPARTSFELAALCFDIARAQAGDLGALFGLYANGMAGYLELANVFIDQILYDPPDPNFTVLFEYSGVSVSADWGMSLASNQYLNKTLSLLLQLYESYIGSLTSLERLQGAIAARDRVWEKNQYSALQSFAYDREVLSNEVADLVDGLPDVLALEGIPDKVFNATEFESTLDQIETEGVPQDIVDVYINHTGDANIEEKLVGAALALRGKTLSTSLYGTLHAFADSLRITEDLSADTDVDSVLDGFDNCRQTPNTDQADDDSDAVGNACDHCPDSEASEEVGVFGCPVPVSDMDSDGVPNDVDACPNTSAGAAVDGNGCSAAQLDADGDGIADAVDNCAQESNANQLDGDSDTVGNVCDNCVDTANTDQADTDNNGVGNACEVVTTRTCDADKDGDIDKADITLITAAKGQLASGPDDPRDADHNGVIDVLDARKCTLSCDEGNCAAPPIGC